MLKDQQVLSDDSIRIYELRSTNDLFFTFEKADRVIFSLQSALNIDVFESL